MENLINLQGEYIKILEQSNENAYRRLAKLGQFANKDDRVLGEKFRKWIEEAKDEISKKNKN